MRASLVALVFCATPLFADPRLELVSVYHWDRPERFFGGWSAIEVSVDGQSFIAIGDDAQRFRGAFERDGSTIVGVAMAPIEALVDTTGMAFFEMNDPTINDSEGLALLSDGSFAVSFERIPRILLYGDGPPTHIETPPLVNTLPENGGIEALATDHDDRLIAIPESIPDMAPGFPIWRQGESGWQTLGHIRKTQGFQPVGADVAPDGRLFVLERAFRLIGFQSRIRIFDLDHIYPIGQLIWSSHLGEFDNLEGLSIWIDANGQTRLTLISDDNYMPLQETQIVEFLLTE